MMTYEYWAAVEHASVDSLKLTLKAMVTKSIVSGHRLHWKYMLCHPFLIRVQSSPHMRSTASCLVVLFVLDLQCIYCNSWWNCSSTVYQHLSFCLCKEQPLSVMIRSKQSGRFQGMQCLCKARVGAYVWSSPRQWTGRLFALLIKLWWRPKEGAV